MATRENDDGPVRRTIEELVTRYEEFPEFRDVFVEGNKDRRFFKWFLQQACIKNVVVYDIDTVDIPQALLDKYALESGKKERIVALAYELNGRIENPSQVSCVADRDFDTLFSKTYSTPLLFLTDYSCQEAYLLQESTIEKFLLLAAGRIVDDVAVLLNSIISSLAALHLLRATNKSLDWGMPWHDPLKCCEIRGDKLHLDEPEFTNRYLTRNQRGKQREEFSQRLKALRAQMGSNQLLYVTKDDIHNIISFVIKELGGSSALHRPEGVEAALLGCLEFSAAQAFPLYSQLITRLQAK